MILTALALCVAAPATPTLHALAADTEDGGSARRTPVVRAVEKVGPAVVNVHTETIIDPPFGGLPGPTGDPFFDRFFRGLRPSRGRASEHLSDPACWSRKTGLW